MEVKGIVLALPDIAIEDTMDYNRWYDLDHIAEHISKPDVLMGRRYVAPRDLRALEGVLTDEFTGGYPRYATIYSLGVDDFTSDEVMAYWKIKDRGLIKAGRFWQVGPVYGLGRWHTDGVRKRTSVQVADEAVPYVAHRGMIVAIGRAADPARQDAAQAWWDNTHIPDLLNVPGVLACLRYRPADETSEGRMLLILMLEDDPADVMPRIMAALKFSHSVGRYPAFGGVYEPVAFLPYRSIVPLQYDFEF